MPPNVELVATNSGPSGTTGSSSWYYSTAPPSQSVSAMPKPEDLRVRKAKTAAQSQISSSSSTYNPLGVGASASANQQQQSPLDAKRELAISRRIAELEKVNWKDVQIKIEQPFSSARPKSQNVRRILASAKTFSNYLSDEIANQELQAQNPMYKPEPYDPATTPLGYVKSVMEPPATQATRYRRFCEICGYWGDIGCMRCDARLCSGECEVTHREARCARRF